MLLCYVLHHAQDVRLVLDEVRRVLRDGGVTVVYEDNPSSLFDRAVCWTHNVQWKSRTGPCTFQLEGEWRRLFCLAGFTIITQRELSRWRNISHPVARNFFVLRAEPSAIETTRPLRSLAAALYCEDSFSNTSERSTKSALALPLQP